MPTVTLTPDGVPVLPYVGRGSNQQCIYWDRTLSCFGVRVYPSGRRAYVCSYRLQRRKRLQVLGRVEVLTLDQARLLGIATLAKVAIGADPQESSRKRRPAKTMAVLCEQFIENHAKKKRRSWKNDESCLRRRILPRLKHRLVSTIVSADLSPIHSEVGVHYPYAANTVLELVRTMFNWGRVVGLVPRDNVDPTAGIVRFPARKRRRYLTTVEMPEFIRALEAEDNDYARHGLWLLLLLGLRSTELLHAKWSDVDWDAGTLFVGLTKNGEPLLAPLGDAAMERLKSIPRIPNNPHIICGRRAGRPLTGLGRPLRRVLRRAGLQNLRVHDLRRTVGSWLAQAGVSLHLIGDVLNHRDLKTTLGYAYFQTQQRRDALTDHGNKVLSCAASQLRGSAEPRTLCVEAVLVQMYAGSRHRHYFKRETLHELVWTAPVSEIAWRLGVSDVGLAKLCRRAEIPTPGRGYWARMESGQHVDRPLLPAAPHGLPSLLRIRGHKWLQNSGDTTTSRRVPDESRAFDAEV